MSTRVDRPFVDGIPSTAALRGHPVHPMVVPFPIAFLCGALVTDLAWVATAQPFWALCSFWLLAAGPVTALVAAVLGLTDFLGEPRIRNLLVARLHFAGNAVVIVIAAVNVWLRLEDPVVGADAAAVALSAVAAVILVGTGWLGGELAYRYRVGVIRDGG